MARGHGPLEWDDVIVTAVTPFGESDAVVRVLGLTRGRIAVFARGARASRRRFPGLSAPSLGRALIESRHGAELLTLHELDLDPALLPLGEDLRAWGHAAYLVELIERLLPEGEPASDVFTLMCAALKRIARHGASATLLRAVELKMLLALGYLPELRHPDAEGSQLPADARAAAIGLLQMTDLAKLPELETSLLRQIATIFAAHLRAQGGAPLRSVQFLASLEGASLAGSDRSR